MSDEEYVFRQTIKEKKGMANGARHTKGKTQRSGRPKDINVTQKEYDMKCGTVKSYTMSMPIRLETFNTLPRDLQKEYLSKLINILHMNRGVISRMFGCSVDVAGNILRQAGIKYPNKPGRVKKSDVELWNSFFSRNPEFHELIIDTGKKKETPIKAEDQKEFEEEVIEEKITEVSEDNVITVSEEVSTQIEEVSKEEVTEVKEEVKQMEEKKTPMVISSTIQMYAKNYADIAEQLLDFIDQDFPGNELIIRVVRK